MRRVYVAPRLLCRALGPPCRQYHRPIPPHLLTSDVPNRIRKSLVLGTDGYSEIRGSVLLDKPEEFVTCPQIRIHTAKDIFNRGVEIAGNEPCLSTFSTKSNRYEHLTFKEVKEQVHWLASAMVNVGLQPSNSTFVGIQSRNRKEQTMAVLAASLNSMVAVPFYDTITEQNLQCIVNQTEAQIVFCENDAMLEKLMKLRPEKLKNVVVMGNLQSEMAKKALKLGINTWSFENFMAIGRQNPCELKSPTPDDAMLILYTSGTTGLPKGVICTHRYVVTNMSSVVSALGKFNRDGGTYMSYLPPAHAYEFVMQMKALYHGRNIAYYRGNVANLVEDFQLIRPTAIPLVPRVMNRLYKMMMEDIQANRYKRTMFNAALKAKERMLKEGIVTKNSVWDRLVFSGAQKLFGGRQEFIIVGSAPSSKDIVRFFQRASGAAFFEGYGQSEGCVMSVALPCETDGGVLGAPTPTVHIQLRDVPEMGYSVKDSGVGEIWVRGPGITPGYFKNPELTEESKDGDWWKTGDIAKWTEEGYLTMVDRRSHIFKLSQGVFVAPEKLESVYLQSELVTQVFVDGRSDKDYIVAVVAADPSALARVATKLGLGMEPVEVQMESTEVRKAFLKNLHEVGRANDLNTLELVRNISLTTVNFAEQGLLTPTFKLRRIIARQIFKQTIEDLYKEPPLCSKMD